MTVSQNTTVSPPAREPEPTVYIVDDDPATRDAMETLFASVSLQTRGFASAEAFLEDQEAVSPGCLILDLRMPGMSGLELQNTLAKTGRSLPIVFMSGHGNINAAVRAMRGGAVDFLTKPVDDEALLARVRAALQHQSVQHRQVADAEELRLRLETLTPRERQVLEGVVAGKANKVIGRDLDISHKTVELHRSHMMEKMQASSIAEVVRYYLTATGEPASRVSEEEE